MKIYLNIAKDMKKKLSNDLNNPKLYFTSLNDNDTKLNLNDLKTIYVNDSMYSDSGFKGYLQFLGELLILIDSGDIEGEE
jgi:hypothetical protein